MPSRVLIVDDEPNIIGTVAPLLRAHGYEVFSAMSACAAFDAEERDRKKIEDGPSRPKYIVTEPWVGYRFADDSND